MSELEASGHSDRVEEHLMRISAKDGFPMMIPGFLPKTHKALSVAEMGRDLGDAQHWALHHAIFGAYFADGRDIADEEVLVEVAGAEGYQADEVRSVLEDGMYDERLSDFRHIALHMGLDSTPAALVCNELIIGSRPYAVFQESLERCLVTADNVEEMANEELDDDELV